MTELLNKFSEAAKAVSSSKTLMWECVKQACVDHLIDICRDDLTEEIQIFYDSVKLRVTSVEPPGHIGNDEAIHIVNEIM